MKNIHFSSESPLLFRAAFMLFLVLLIFTREPMFFLEPRIWAEEGTVHLSSVISHGYYKSLFIPHLGYYSLFNNYIASLGLYLFGLWGVAYFSTYMSCVMMLVVVLAPYYLSSKYWKDEKDKAILSLFALTCGSGEIWLNTVNVQFFLGLFTCFILLSDVGSLSRKKMLFICFFLIQAALTGITSVILTPFFLFKFFRLPNKLRRNDLVILAVLSSGLLVQIFALCYLSTSSDFTRLDLKYLVNFPYAVVHHLTLYVDHGFYSKLFVITLLALLFLRSGMSLEEALPFLLAIYVSIVFSLLALEMSGAGRYAYIPTVLIFIFLKHLRLKVFSKAYYLRSVLLYILMIFSISKYFLEIDRFYEKHWSSYSFSNILQLQEDLFQVKIFPQWNETNWRILLTREQVEKYS